jgi:hypothetical protein
MPYLIADNFSGGLDSRRHILNSKEGTLAVLENAHVTRGGEIEKRKAFSSFASLPVGTFGLEATLDKIYVFGSTATPVGVPATVTYQRLEHPDGLPMTGVKWSTIYGGLPFVIAEYSDGAHYSFWDGSIVNDSFVGVVRTSMVNMDNFAEHLKSYFSLDGYTCTRTGSTLTLTAGIGKAFDVTESITAPMTAVVTRTQEAKVPVEGKTAYGSFTISGGTEEPALASTDFRYIDADALPDITGIYVNGIDILNLSPGSGIQWDSIPNGSLSNVGPRFAYTLWTFINANSSNSGFTAAYKVTQFSGPDNGKITIQADSALGTSANGWDVKIEFLTDPSGVTDLGELIDGSPVASPYNAGRFIAELNGPGVLAGGAYNGITSVTVDGVEIMGETIPWKVSNSSTAQDIVDAIEAYTSTPEYLTETENGIVTVNALSGTGTAPNERVVNVQTQGNVVASAITKMANGTANYAGQAQISTVAFGGTFTVGGKASVTITDSALSYPYIFGASRIAGVKPSFSITYKGKEYMAADSTMYFSALNDATKWGLYDIGSGFIDMSNNFGGREPLTGFGVYQNKMAAFSRRNIQLWYLDADPANNAQDHVLANTGAISPDSVVSMGSIDILYLSDSGIRSVRARENTDTAYANDIGSAIDGIIVNQLSDLTEDEKLKAKAVIEPDDGRYWLCIEGVIYVLSYFPGSNILAWSTYTPGFVVNEIVTQLNRVYVRSSDTIYIYGGSDGVTYDDSEVTIEMPYLDAKKPATYKALRGIDVTLEGLWEISIGFDHTNPTARDVIARIDSPSFALGKIDATGSGTHFGVKLVNSEVGYAKLACLIVHYDDQHSKHDAG